MPSIDRTLILAGPAQVIFDGVTFYSAGDIVVKPIFERLAIKTSGMGQVAKRQFDRMFEISFTPSGQFSSGIAQKLFPFGGASVIGTSPFGTVDTALAVHGRDGIRITFHNAGITKVPNITLAVNKTSLGPMTFTALLKNNSDPGTTDSYYTIAGGGYPGDSSFDAAAHFTAHPSIAWGESAPWNSILTEGGIEFTFGMNLDKSGYVDGLGTVNMIITDVSASASCIPVGPSLAAVLDAAEMATDFGIDQAMLPLTAERELSGSESVLLRRATFEDPEFYWDNGKKRVGKVTWTANRDPAAGLYAVSGVTISDGFAAV